MVTREGLWKHFGPVIIEALALVVKDEINLLRVEHSLPERTDQQLFDAVDTKLKSLPKYDWMNTS